MRGATEDNSELSHVWPLNESRVDTELSGTRISKAKPPGMTHRILSRVFQIFFSLSVSLYHLLKSTLEIRIITFHD